ncbi:hypothetical protein MUY27_00865 [Mucilaginibacter sp. RS28]|uniref:Uncharacterized protein n=1 Tax=Mucilaginibacter straminoryzae TaxID=2932774 RepID=A0A9X1WYZ4_9SPHI|nr:hypothetical protein [Mucilaginibacter straminoryzae]MCJ8208237.1 hypothetical protein [Mucilaginibacter straminoryzae]
MTTCGFSASAQWISFKKHERLPLLPEASISSSYQFKTPAFAKFIPRHPEVTPSAYSQNLTEHYVMHMAQHNMRYRVFNTASYNFSQLAQFYVQQKRMSEAKWFFLQSNMLSRQQNNDKLTIHNLTRLAEIKSFIGDFTLAQQDLFEARDIAASRGWLIELVFVEKKLQAIQQNRIVSTCTELRYASNAIATKQNPVE